MMVKFRYHIYITKGGCQWQNAFKCSEKNFIDVNVHGNVSTTGGTEKKFIRLISGDNFGKCNKQKFFHKPTLQLSLHNSKLNL